MTFQEWIQGQIQRRFRTPTAMAKALGMKLTPFQRGVETGTFNVVNLLKLAQLTEAHPSTVLRLGKKTSEADLIESLYGPGRDALTKSQRELIEIWEELPEEDVRTPFLVLLRYARQLAATDRGEEKTAPASTPRRRRPRASRRRSGARPPE